MNEEPFSPDFKTLSLTVEDILFEMGYGTVQPQEDIYGFIGFLLDEISGMTNPSYIYKTVEGEIINGIARFNSGSSLDVGRVIASLLTDSTRFALFAATAGIAFQHYQDIIREENDLLKTFIVDTIGTCIVERTGDMIEKSLEERIGDDKHTHRFSPGYCGWNLYTQKQLFELLGGNPCGIELSEVCLMKPIKSISGIIGIGKNVNEKTYGCRYCELETCYKRKNKIK